MTSELTTKTSHEAAVHAATLLARAYRQDITPELLAAWEAGLGDLAPDLIQQATVLAVRSCKWMPTPADLRTLLAEQQGERPHFEHAPAADERSYRCPMCRDTGLAEVYNREFVVWSQGAVDELDRKSQPALGELFRRWRARDGAASCQSSLTYCALCRCKAGESKSEAWRTRPLKQRPAPPRDVQQIDSRDVIVRDLTAVDFELTAWEWPTFQEMFT